MNFLSKYKNIHFIGIGGISMSGIAELCKSHGINVSGSDRAKSSILDHLSEIGCRIYEEHCASNVLNCDLIVYTSAISSDNPELLAAIQYKLPTLSRTEFLGKLMKEYSLRIAISGTHGKTTTTSMLSELLCHTENPTIMVGGKNKHLNGNVKIGEQKIFLTEACEYRENFLDLTPNYIAMLNVEWDHPDYYPTADSFTQAFVKFIKNLPKEGTLVYNGDDSNCNLIAKQFFGKKLSFGTDSNCTLQILRQEQLDSQMVFTFSLSGNMYSGKLNTLGIHNIWNAAAAILIFYDLGYDISLGLKLLENFEMTERRMNYLGKHSKGFHVFDDYGHHPTAIRSTLSSLKKLSTQKLWVVFEPHTYSRTKSLFQEFGDSFSDADVIILVPIYAAREPVDPSVSSQKLGEYIRSLGKIVYYFDTFDDVISYALDHLEKEDIFLTIGAGNVTTIAHEILLR